MPIARKQRSSSSEWWDAWRRIEDLVPYARYRQLVERAVAKVRHEAAGLSRCAYGWSGGKDSQALRIVCEAAGVGECVLVITDLEYPEFLRWATLDMPDGLEVVTTGQDLDWLCAHPDMLFPDSAHASRWFSIVQHRGQAIYERERAIEALFLGRRRADGNQVPPGARYRKDGVLRVLPIADWTHEEVLAACYYGEQSLAPCYHWPRGWQVGTGAWPARQFAGSHDQAWDEVGVIDADVLAIAAGRFPGAAAALERMGGAD